MCPPDPTDSEEAVAEVAEVQARPVATVRGEPVLELPQDLYIPPDALEVILETFEGPLDLLLYLIRRQNLDILDIPVLKITQQYMEYIGLMQELRLEIAAEYLLMAAMLAEIKSRLLLPRPVTEDEEADDPRAELVRRLQEYERFKTAAETLDELPRVGREIFVAQARAERVDVVEEMPRPELKSLLLALRDVMQRAELFTSHMIEREPLSVRERMTLIIDRLQVGRRMQFHELVDLEEGRIGVVVTFIAILELVKSAVAELEQESPFAPVMVYAAGPRSDRGADAGDVNGQE